MTRDFILNWTLEGQDYDLKGSIRKKKYSGPDPHGAWRHDKLIQVKVKVKVTLRLTVSQSVSLCIEPQLGFMTLWQLRSWSYGAPSLTRGRLCLLYMLLVLASVVFLGSEFLGTRDHILLSQIWDFPFRRLLRLAGSRWRYSNLPPHGRSSPRAIGPARTAQKMSFSLFHVAVNVSTELFPSNGCCTVSCLHSSYSAMSLHVTLHFG
jgi:hypothetical protein